MPLLKKGTTKSPDAEPQSAEALPLIPANTLGLRILFAPEHEPTLDIVAVHGLGGDAFRTWTHANGKLWLRDFLPEALDRTRIMTFGYDVNVFTKASTQRSFGFAEDLVSSVNDERTGLARTRPLFFVAHSLGGIVVKKALLIAQARESLYKDLLSSVYHLVFFGTPHQGVNSGAEFITNLGVAVTRAKEGSALRELKLWSPSLMEANALFVDIAEGFTITTFYEREKTHGVQVVNEGSARLAKAKETVIGLDGNHLEICKFPTVDDPMYRKVLGRLQAEVSQINEREATKEHERRVQRLLHDEKVLDKLPIAKLAPFDGYERRHNPFCLPETRVEVCKQIRAWVYGNDDNEDNCIFWLNGMAGSGKSTIARTMALEFRDKGQLGASFFFARGRGDAAHARFFFTTIARQLLRIGNITLHRSICNAISKHPDIATKRLEDQWQELIYRPLSDLRSDSVSSPLVIIVDGLDECDNGKDIERIVQLLTQARRLPAVRLRVVATSRPEMSIQSVFRRPGITHRDLILQNVPRVIVDADICLFFYAEFEEIKRMFSWLQETSQGHDWPGVDNINSLVQAAAGLFIYAATICRFLKAEDDEQEMESPEYEEENMSSSDDEEENILSPEERLALFLPPPGSDRSVQQSAPESPQAPHTKGIDRIYAQILKHAFRCAKTERNRTLLVTAFRGIIGSIVVLLEPLPVQSLALLLGMDRSNVYHHLRHYHSVLDVGQDLSAPVRLFHLSFRDYLTTLGRYGNEEFYVDTKERHEVLTHQCLQIMSGLREDICHLKNPGVLVTEVNPSIMSKHLPLEIQYACRHWTSHAQQSETEIHDNGEVHEFLQKHFLHWLEALGWLGRLAEAIECVKTLQSLMSAQDSTRVSAFLEDARRFVLANRYIGDLAPLQLHSSAVVFAPQSSIVKEVCGKVPGWIKKSSVPPGKGGAELQKLEGHTERVNAVAFSPNGSLLTSASSDTTVRIWDAKTGDQIQVLENHPHISKIDFTSDGRALSTNRGLIDLGAVPSVPETGELGASKNLLFKDEWLHCGEKRVLWLPHEHRSDVSAVYNNMVAIGHGSGLVATLEIQYE